MSLYVDWENDILFKANLSNGCFEPLKFESSWMPTTVQKTCLILTYISEYVIVNFFQPLLICINLFFYWHLIVKESNIYIKELF